MTSGTAVIAAAAHPMAWTNERLKLSCADGIGFKTLWKMLLEKSDAQQQQQQQHQQQQQRSSNNSTATSNSLSSNDTSATAYLGQSVTIAELLEHREDRRLAARDNMSLLKCLAINALELSAPASPLLLLQSHIDTAIASSASAAAAAAAASAAAASAAAAAAPHPPQTPPTPTTNPKSPGCGWLQLAGHPESIAPAANGTVRKRISGPSDSEAIAYRGLSCDPHAVHLIPQYYGCHPAAAEDNALTSEPTTTQHYLELQNLLAGFHNPAVMDIKMGRRTFLESEVTNDTLRPDLYRKMAAVDEAALTTAEHGQSAITKLRYMLFREQMSSSQHHGFRVEALKMRGRRPVTDLKTMKCGLQLDETLAGFVAGQADVTGELIGRLRSMRALIERSAFFAEHEVVGCSVFIVYDAERVGAWLIDFAKCRRLPQGVQVDHRRPWVRGNHEEGLLHGFDELIAAFERIREQQQREVEEEEQGNCA